MAYVARIAAAAPFGAIGGKPLPRLWLSALLLLAGARGECEEEGRLPGPLPPPLAIPSRLRPSKSGSWRCERLGSTVHAGGPGTVGAGEALTDLAVVLLERCRCLRGKPEASAMSSNSWGNCSKPKCSKIYAWAASNWNRSCWIKRSFGSKFTVGLFLMSAA